MSMLAEVPPGLWPTLHVMMGGMIVALFFVAALLFLRFYRKTRDRLFAFFAAAFAIMAANRLGLIFTNDNEVQTSFYIVRLLAFALILYAIIDKNRLAGHRGK